MGLMPALAALPPLPVAAATTTAALAGPAVTIPTIAQPGLAVTPTLPVAVQAPLSMPAGVPRRGVGAASQPVGDEDPGSRVC